MGLCPGGRILLPGAPLQGDLHGQILAAFHQSRTMIYSTRIKGAGIVSVGLDPLISMAMR